VKHVGKWTVLKSWSIGGISDSIGLDGFGAKASGRPNDLAVPGEADHGRGDQETVRAVRCHAEAGWLHRRERIDMKFGFIAKHRGIWAVDWMRGARRLAGGFYAWLTRPRTRSQSEEELGAKIRASFLPSDRTYGARRVWYDLSDIVRSASR
jgi:hypothetical protein